MGTYSILFHEKDRGAARELTVHLAMFRRSGWSEVGLEDRPMIILGIMSPELISERESELDRAVNLTKEGARFIPIIYRPFDGDRSLPQQALPRDKSVMEHDSTDLAWTRIVSEIREVAKGMGG